MKVALDIINCRADILEDYTLHSTLTDSKVSSWFNTQSIELQISQDLGNELNNIGVNTAG